MTCRYNIGVTFAKPSSPCPCRIIARSRSACVVRARVGLFADHLEPSYHNRIAVSMTVDSTRSLCPSTSIQRSISIRIRRFYGIASSIAVDSTSSGPSERTRIPWFRIAPYLEEGCVEVKPGCCCTYRPGCRCTYLSYRHFPGCGWALRRLEPRSLSDTPSPDLRAEDSVSLNRVSAV